MTHQALQRHTPRRAQRAVTRPELSLGSSPLRSHLAVPTLGLDASVEALFTAPDLIDLQRAAGNQAVSQLIQRAPAPNTPQTPASSPVAGQEVATVEPSPLSDSRIAWIEDLPETIRFSIDAMGDDKLGKRIRSIDAALERQRATIATATTPEAKQAATDTMTSSAETKAKEDIVKLHGKRWAKGRLALMDYLGCSLGGDAGVERYFRSLVQFGAKELWVHPEAARRLARVQQELEQEHIPMPETDVGFGLRGRHIHPRTQDLYPGMMIHSLGVAVDWEAYKNVHIRDEQFMALITAVTGHAHNIEMPAGGLRTITALGERSMGNTLSAADQKDVAKGDALIDTIGREFDRLEADSDAFRDSLTFDKADLISLHDEIRVVQAPLEAAQERLNNAGQRPGPALRAEVTRLQAIVDAKMAELRPRLSQLFQPWLTALSRAADATRKEAEPLLKGKSLDAVLTEVGLQSKAGAVAAATAPAVKDLEKVSKATADATAKTQSVRTKIAGAQAYLAKSSTDQEKADWTQQLNQLDTRAAGVLGRGAAVSSQAQVLRGRAPTARAAAAPATKPRKPAWEKEFSAWDTEIAARESAMSAAEASLQATTDTLSPASLTAAYTLRDERAANEAIRTQVTRDQFEQLQALKAKLWHLQRASVRLLNDASFMFPRASVRDPGVAQLTGVLERNESGRRADIGGGGFFGTPTSAKEAAAKVAATGRGKAPSAAGFGKRFFQIMVKYGFEPASTWHTSDSMHFQVRGLVDQIVPAKACEEPPAGAEDKAKDDKARAAIAEARTKAAAARQSGETFASASEQKRRVWDSERAH